MGFTVVQWENENSVVISSPVSRDLQHSSVRTCALATLCITTLSARVGEVCSIKALFILRRLAVVTSVSVVGEKKVVGAVELKVGQQLTYRLVRTRVEWPCIKLRF